MKYEIEHNGISILLDKDIYSSDVLHKCFYWYGAGYSVTIASASTYEYKVVLQSKSENINIDHLLEKIQQDLIDFKLRDIVTRETGTIRELIVAKAFAYYDVEENPLTEISDPVGFNPNVISNE